MELDAQFQTATETVKKFTFKPSTERLLELYSLYKQATKGDVDIEAPSPMNLSARAKYEAWKKLEGTDQNDAKYKYVELVDYLASKPKQSVT